AVKLLLSHLKIDVNKADDWGETPLLEAAENGHIEAVKLLLSHLKIDVNKANIWDQAPIDEAVRRGDVDVANALLSDPDIDVNFKVREYLYRLVNNDDVDSIQEIVLNGCSEKVYDHLYTKAIEIGKPQLIKRLRHLVPGYSNTEALGGHNKAYNTGTAVPEGILRTVKEYLNPKLPEQQR
ncbi:MAG: ankyrin repeat domain-containing protein, partial [Desulfobacteraceae bacterium]|nr:ankyrin repeat domain-containing protein [Desulfobacteraceae bacterium]